MKQINCYCCPEQLPENEAFLLNGKDYCEGCWEDLAWQESESIPDWEYFDSERAS